MEIRFCPYCETKVEEGDRYCKTCGKNIINNIDENFCSEVEQAIKYNPVERRLVYEGNIHKCPSCGEYVKAFSVNCEACGFEFRGTRNSTAVQELAAKLEAIEKERKPKTFGVMDILGYGDRLSETDSKKISLIRSFVVPNTKEDYLEFFLLAISCIDMRRYGESGAMSTGEQAVSDAWYAKFEQTYEKAKLSYGNTPEFAKIQAIYDKKNREINKEKKKFTNLFIGIGVFLIALFGICFGMASCGM